MGGGAGLRLWKEALVQIHPNSFRNVIFDITPGDEAGKFEVNARFLGVDMERFQLHYQVRGLSWAYKLPAGLGCWPEDSRPTSLPKPQDISSAPPSRVERSYSPSPSIPLHRPHCQAAGCDFGPVMAEQDESSEP